ncbi:rieske (2Fe-2S) domain protein [Luminiphilus syltensis NOR5-1B]|uniref:Rieske (2Fe-2S) domain protein n=1 Tax=Luminiphilus syltensis NOR5-1B TaxID=565045 RepID=B8KSQ3_9GAMM|nr:aromatic ring-hydroxylating dioxygenase subunit alpha [Luminiphilus syltensis]EED36660.1 rieske (2Fe-2S) domain protein [Luminiphilus syltensis NOR5-1B]
MNNATKKLQGDGGRFEGTTWQDLLDKETVEVPDFLREKSNPYLGDEDLSVDRYISKDFFDLEKEKLWSKVWQMVCREEDLPESGDHVVYDIIDQSVIVVRTNEGTLKGFINSCLHRGRSLRDESGTVGEFRCPFHGATWNLEGEFQGIPCQWDFEHLEDRDMSLPEVQVDTWGGFVFINFDHNCKPLEEYMEVMPEHFSRYPLEKYFKGVHVKRVMNCNWKVGAEAFMESYHTVETHKQILTFTGDANSQYDTYGDHISRSVTPMGVASPHLEGISEEAITRDILKLSGRMAKDSDEGVDMPDGVDARRYVADMNRGMFEEASGQDLSGATMAELEDAILYSLFPNFQVWIGYNGNIVYKFIPNGDDPDSCIFEVMILLRYPEGSERPDPAPCHVIPADESFSSYPNLGALGPVFDQDDANLPAVQKGMKASHKKAVSLASYQESRIRHLHQTIDKYLNA